MSFRWSAPLIAVCCAAVPARAQAQAPVTAFVNVGVIPMDRQRVLSNQTVVVRGDRIVALGPAKQVVVPAGAMRIDGRGKFLIPGLADMHAHVPGINRLLQGILKANKAGDWSVPTFTDDDRAEAEHMLFLYAAAGVTTVRVLHGSADILALRARAATGELFSPRMYVSTPIGAFRGPPDSLAKFPAAAKAAGYDLIKTYGTNGVALDSLAAGARRVGIPIAGHAPGDGSDPKGIERAIQAGYASIEHLSGFPGTWYMSVRTVDTADLHAAAVALQRAGVWSCPTQMVTGFNIGYFTADTLAHWSEMRYLTDTALKSWKEHWKEPSVTQATSVEGARRGLPWMVTYRQIIKALHDAGAGLLLGTDASVPGVLPGFSAHRELAELVKAGLTPYEALVTGTRNVAAYFGTLDSTGTVGVGKRADLVLLTGNPLRDIRETTHRAGVMLGGRWLPQAELERRLAALEGTLF